MNNSGKNTGSTTVGDSLSTSSDLRQVGELSEKYRHIFSSYPTFNIVQSKVFDSILQTDSSIVVSAPTGSGKTVLFELAIIRILETCETTSKNKIVYMAPVKALCSERYFDWLGKFRSLGLRLCEMTGDSNEPVELTTIENVDLVLTTPEKWDALTRRWKDHAGLLQMIKLFMIDEVHLLNEERRGPTLEAVVSRMKTVQEITNLTSDGLGVRFVAVSATIPNIMDITKWLGTPRNPSIFFKFDESVRPVNLRKIVLGYPLRANDKAYMFDVSLTYKLKQVIMAHADGKPTLIFCSSRKSVQQTCFTLKKILSFSFTQEQTSKLQESIGKLLDNNLRELVRYGLAYHHAGLMLSDRQCVEEIFRWGYLPVLISTSTLAMGVNLPAHLVIIKSTEQYICGEWQSYSESQILQMIGRAGRPQFDTIATAVIMTRDTNKIKYEKLVSGNELIESSLHNYLVEHLNAEIALGTITDIAVAMNWLRSTFLYVRALKNPKHYGIPTNLTEGEIESKLQVLGWQDLIIGFVINYNLIVLRVSLEVMLDKITDDFGDFVPNYMHHLLTCEAVCMRELHALEKHQLIAMSDFAYNVQPTENGKLMARYYIAFETMKVFMQIEPTTTLPGLLQHLTRCQEFQEMHLRRHEKPVLNTLNRNKRKESIRFPLEGKILTKAAKSNVLIQAVLGSLPIPDPGLLQESSKVMRLAERLLRGMTLYLGRKKGFAALVSAVTLHKCTVAKMWENSHQVCRQLPGIGPALCTLLVAAEKITFGDIINCDPRTLERIINRQPPMGNTLQEAASRMPQYDVDAVVNNHGSLVLVHVRIHNSEEVQYGNMLHNFTLLIAAENQMLRKEVISDQAIISQNGRYTLQAYAGKVMFSAEEITVSLISNSIVGVDVKKVVKLRTPTNNAIKLVTTEVKNVNKSSEMAKQSLQSFLREYSHVPRPKMNIKLRNTAEDEKPIAIPTIHRMSNQTASFSNSSPAKCEGSRQEVNREIASQLSSKQPIITSHLKGAVTASLVNVQIRAERERVETNLISSYTKPNLQSSTKLRNNIVVASNHQRLSENQSKNDHGFDVDQLFDSSSSECEGDSTFEKEEEISHSNCDVNEVTQDELQPQQNINNPCWDGQTDHIQTRLNNYGSVKNDRVASQYDSRDQRRLYDTEIDFKPQSPTQPINYSQAHMEWDFQPKFGMPTDSFFTQLTEHQHGSNSEGFRFREYPSKLRLEYDDRIKAERSQMNKGRFYTSDESKFFGSNTIPTTSPMFTTPTISRENKFSWLLNEDQENHQENHRSYEHFPPLSSKIDTFEYDEATQFTQTRSNLPQAPVSKRRRYTHENQQDVGEPSNSVCTSLSSLLFIHDGYRMNLNRNDKP